MYHIKMLFKTIVVLLAINVLKTDAGGGDYGTKWNYKVNSANGPSHWKTHFKHCGGKQNSPINILTKEVQMNKDLKLTLHDYNQIGGNFTFSMTNRQTDIGFAGKSKVAGVNLPQSITFKGTKYRFYQFHFHWGTENHKGSEHLLDSQRAAAELHMIHQNTKYADINAAVDKSDGLLVWGHFLKVFHPRLSSQNTKYADISAVLDKPDGLLVWGHFLKVNSKEGVNNAAFQELLNHFEHVAEGGHATRDVNVNLYKLLPTEHDHFFTYQGGLTTPPCYESVRWVVNRQPILVSEKQMKKFRALKDKAMGGFISDNFRPPQEVNDRVVEANFNPADLYTNGAGVTIAPCFLTLLTIASAFFFNY